MGLKQSSLKDVAYSAHLQQVMEQWVGRRRQRRGGHGGVVGAEGSHGGGAGAQMAQGGSN